MRHKNAYILSISPELLFYFLLSKQLRCVINYLANRQRGNSCYFATCCYFDSSCALSVKNIDVSPPTHTVILPKLLNINSL